MIAETIYLGHDNSIDLVLKADNVAVDLTPVTQMTLTVGGETITSTNVGGDPIRWKQAGYATGEIHIQLGGETLTPGNYDAWLIVYDPTNSDGVVWGHFHCEVVAEVEIP